MTVDTRKSSGFIRIPLAGVEEVMSLVQWHFASRRHRKVPVTFLFTGAAMLALTACGEKNAYIAPPPPKVVAAQPLQQPVTRYIEITGNTQSISTVDLEARVQGFLEQINYVDGALVKKDSVLFVIQRNTYEAQLAQAKATLAGNQAAQLNAQIEYDRQAQLQQQQVSTQAKLDDAKQKLDQAIAGVEAPKPTGARPDQSRLHPGGGAVRRHRHPPPGRCRRAGRLCRPDQARDHPADQIPSMSISPSARRSYCASRRGWPSGASMRDVHEVPVEIGTDDREPDTLTRASSTTSRRRSTRPPARSRCAGFSTIRTSLCCRAIRARARSRATVPTGVLGGYRDRPDQLGEYVLVVGKDNTVEQRQVKLGQISGRLRLVAVRAQGGRMGHHCAVCSAPSPATRSTRRRRP